jgi:hypothetical protein
MSADEHEARGIGGGHRTEKQILLTPSGRLLDMRGSAQHAPTANVAVAGAS